MSRRGKKLSPYGYGEPPMLYMNDGIIRYPTEVRKPKQGLYAFKMSTEAVTDRELAKLVARGILSPRNWRLSKTAIKKMLKRGILIGNLSKPRLAKIELDVSTLRVQRPKRRSPKEYGRMMK